MSRQDSTVTARNTYSAEELARLSLPGYPRTRKNWYEVVKREGWACVETPGKGPGGLRREYIPPPEVQALIEAAQRGELAPAAPRVVSHKPPRVETEQKPAPTYQVTPEMQPQINVDALTAILKGLLQAMGPNPDPNRLASAAAEFYVKMVTEGFITPTGAQGTGGKAAA